MGNSEHCTKLCVVCENFAGCIKRLAANDNDPAGIIFLPSDKKLKQRHVPNRLALILSNIIPVDRHNLPDFVTETIWSYGGIVIAPDGRRIDHTSIDAWEEFDVIDGDAGVRWYDDLLEWRFREPKLRPRASQLRRFRTLFLVICIMNPRLGARIL